MPDTVLGTLFYLQEVRIVGDNKIQNESGSFVFPQGFGGEQIKHGIWLRGKYRGQVFLLDSQLPACVDQKSFSPICNKCVIILKQLKSKTKSLQAVTGLIRKRIQIPLSATLSSVEIFIIINFF